MRVIWQKVLRKEGGIDMETKFNFNSQICTTKEQSERLLALGLKKETADMKYPCISEYYGDVLTEGTSSLPIIIDTEDDDITEYDTPAWSLHRLWELLSKIKKYEGEDELMYPRIFIEEDDVILVNPKSIWVRQSFCSPKGVYENIINCFELLIKKGYFNKEYLV